MTVGGSLLSFKLSFSKCPGMSLLGRSHRSLFTELNNIGFQHFFFQRYSSLKCIFTTLITCDVQKMFGFSHLLIFGTYYKCPVTILWNETLKLLQVVVMS